MLSVCWLHRKRPSFIVNNAHHFFCSNLPLSGATPPHLVWQRHTKLQLNLISAEINQSRLGWLGAQCSPTNTLPVISAANSPNPIFSIRYLLNQCCSFKILNGFLKVLLLKVVGSQPCSHTDVTGEVPERLGQEQTKAKPTARLKNDLAKTENAPFTSV